MEKQMASSIFVNDGSFMERFKQLQQEQERGKEKDAAQQRSKVAPTVSGAPTSKIGPSKTGMEFKANDYQKNSPAASSGKLAFSLKQKSKLAAPPVKLGEDEDEDEKDTKDPPCNGLPKRQKLGHVDAAEQSSKEADVAPPSPSDSTVKKVADKLASFVAKNGRQFEHITRQKNPGDTPFKFLFDESCSDYKYYEFRLGEEEKALSRAKNSQTSQNGRTSTSAQNSVRGSQRSQQQHLNYQTPASALYESADNKGTNARMVSMKSDESTPPSGADPIAIMEFYAKKAAQEERWKQPKQSKDEMPPPASLKTSGKRGHHMGDYIPLEELDKFLASCNDAAAQKAAKEAVQRAKIQADNVGHKLLSKMGWKEGEGLGSSKNGIADPIMAGDVKINNLGVGAHNPGEVTPDDDIYEQYKKRMMLGYRYRPNPLGNPRKAYY